MERIGAALREPTPEPDRVSPPWLGRLQVVLALLSIPILFVMFQTSHEHLPATPAPRLARGPVTDPSVLARHTEVIAARRSEIETSGRAYETTMHSGLARLDDGTLLAHHATEVQIARSSTPLCAAIASHVIDDVFLLPQLATFGEDAMHSWETQSDAAVRHELDGTGMALPDDPDRVLDEAWTAALVGLFPDDAEQRLVRMSIDPEDDAETRCMTYLAQEDLLAQMPLERRAAIIRARHLVAARAGHLEPW